MGRHDRRVVYCATNLDRLRPELKRLAAGSLSIAEINRLLGAHAETLGLRRPSYARVRQLVHEERERIPVPSWGELLLDVEFRVREPTVLIEKAAGTLPMREDAGIRRDKR